MPTAETNASQAWSLHERANREYRNITSGESSYLFTITTGRSGTAFLAALLAANLPGAECHHEVLGYDRFGIDTPDVSHMTLFNSRGNVPEVRVFWDRKFARIRSSAQFYAETSHILVKAGLLENLERLAPKSQMHVVNLTRDSFQTLRSFRNRFDFTNKGMWWLWYLDPEYPNKLVDSRRLMTLGVDGVALWYIYEMHARAAYYKHLLRDREDIRFHDLDLKDLADKTKVSEFLGALGFARPADDVQIPPPQNESRNAIDWGPDWEKAARRMIADARFDPEAVAKGFIDSGRSLAAGPLVR